MQEPNIVIVTSCGRDEVIQEAEALGKQDVLIKSVNGSVLLDSVVHILRPSASGTIEGPPPAFQQLPVIAMNARSLREDQDRCTEAGMNEFVSTPLNPDALFEAQRKYYPGNDC